MTTTGATKEEEGQALEELLEKFETGVADGLRDYDNIRLTNLFKGVKGLLEPDGKPIYTDIGSVDDITSGNLLQSVQTIARHCLRDGVGQPAYITDINSGKERRATNGFGMLLAPEPGSDRKDWFFVYWAHPANVDRQEIHQPRTAEEAEALIKSLADGTYDTKLEMESVRFIWRATR